MLTWEPLPTPMGGKENIEDIFPLTSLTLFLCTYILTWLSRNSQSFDAKFTSYTNSIFLGIMAGGSKRNMKMPMRNSIQSNGLTSKIPFEDNVTVLLYAAKL